MKKVIHDSEVLKSGQQVLTACAFIHKTEDGEPKVFLAKRADTKKFLPGVFELPGGHIDFGEEMEAGLKREVQEEFGIEISVGDPISAFTYMNEIKESHSLEIIYFAKMVDEKSNITLHPEDHSEYVWLSEKELPKAYNLEKGQEDVEFKIILKGFKLLKGEPLDFGSSSLG